MIFESLMLYGFLPSFKNPFHLLNHDFIHNASQKRSIYFHSKNFCLLVTYCWIQARAARQRTQIDCARLVLDRSVTLENYLMNNGRIHWILQSYSWSKAKLKLKLKNTFLLTHCWSIRGIQFILPWIQSIFRCIFHWKYVEQIIVY